MRNTRGRTILAVAALLGVAFGWPASRALAAVTARFDVAVQVVQNKGGTDGKAYFSVQHFTVDLCLTDEEGALLNGAAGNIAGNFALLSEARQQELLAQVRDQAAEFGYNDVYDHEGSSFDIIWEPVPAGVTPAPTYVKNGQWPVMPLRVYIGYLTGATKTDGTPEHKEVNSYVMLHVPIEYLAATELRYTCGAMVNHGPAFAANPYLWSLVDDTPYRNGYTPPATYTGLTPENLYVGVRQAHAYYEFPTTVTGIYYQGDAFYPGINTDQYPAEGPAPYTINFTSYVNGGSGDFTYAWDFGVDGAGSTAQNPGSYTYGAPGTYEVTLRVTDTESQQTVPVTTHVYVASTEPVEASTEVVDPGVAVVTTYGFIFSSGPDGQVSVGWPAWQSAVYGAPGYQEILDAAFRAGFPLPQPGLDSVNNDNVGGRDPAIRFTGEEVQE